jgi:hypothetical protein
MSRQPDAAGQGHEGGPIGIPGLLLYQVVYRRIAALMRALSGD